MSIVSNGAMAQTKIAVTRGVEEERIERPAN
jgi:hypothetical protein